MKFLKYLLIILAILCIGGCFAFKIMSEPEPNGKQGAEADQLAQKVMVNLGKPAYDTLGFVTWEFFRGGHKYVWDKQNDRALIEWGENKVFLNLNSLEARCYKQGKEVLSEERHKLKETAWSYWCNDSFWLIAPFKMFDKGTTRSLVNVDGNNKGLLISYNSGGVTPGDKYLWIIDQNNMPIAWKMWTGILPIKGLKSDWGNWNTYNGVKLASQRTMFGKELQLKGVKAGMSLTDISQKEDLFESN